MAKKPDTPCAGGCGKLLWSGRTSLPVGQRKCRDCRRAAHGRAPDVRGDPCSNCGKPTTPHRKTCSEACARERQAVQFRRLSSMPNHLRPLGQCDDCGKHTTRHVTAYGRFCKPCAGARKRARESRKVSKRRTAQRFTDITAAFERELRRRIRRCILCSTWMTSKPGKPNSKQLDHIIPIVLGGTHTIGNVRIICRTCNLSRPKDGSDLDGHQPTLWAQDLASAAVVAPARPRCSCGKLLRDGRCRHCDPPRLHPRASLHPEDGRAAAEMRARGMKWREISDALHLSGPGTAYQVASKFGEPEVIAKWARARDWDPRSAA